jgi:hypothetical protein
MNRNILPVFFCLVLFASCKKESQNNCNNIGNLTLESNSPVTIGEVLKFGTQEVGGYRVYKWTGPNYYDSQYPDDQIMYAELKHEGWYYMSVYSLDGDCNKIDSIYLDVKLQQGSPACSVTANSTNFNNLGNDNYTSVNKHIESNFSQKCLEGSGGFYSNIKIYFHTHWRTAEPEDGIYTTINTPLFDPVDNIYNKVFITTTKSSIYWASHPDQQVYISHVGNKLQVRFCDLSMGGSNGTSYTTIASGNIIEL